MRCDKINSRMIDMNHPYVKNKIHFLQLCSVVYSQAVILVNIDNLLNNFYCKGVVVKSKES